MPATNNAKWNFGIAPCDLKGNPLGVDTAGAYECHVKANAGDPDPVVKFKTGGGTGFGTIQTSTFTENAVVFGYYLFNVDKALVENVEPGYYVADVLRTDGAQPEWVAGFELRVTEGVTKL